MVTVLYFARLREALGTANEEIALPESVIDLASLREALVSRGGAWAQELAQTRPVRAASRAPLMCWASARNFITSFNTATWRLISSVVALGGSGFHRLFSGDALHGFQVLLRDLVLVPGLSPRDLGVIDFLLGYRSFFI